MVLILYSNALLQPCPEAFAWFNWVNTKLIAGVSAERVCITESSLTLDNIAGAQRIVGASLVRQGHLPAWLCHHW